MFGDHGYPFPGVLIELRNPNQASKSELRDAYWYVFVFCLAAEALRADRPNRPLVSTANAVMEVWSRVPKDLVIFTSPEKPLPRVGKGSVARKAALQLYKVEIAQM